jgi:uncharacterized delta-60 repeat protein
MKISRPINRLRQVLNLAIEPLESRCLLSVTLDSAFGASGTGKVLTDYNLQSNSAFAVALSGGKILVAGTSNGDFALTRYNADGTLDSTFGDHGFITTDFGSGSDAAYAIAVQSDGRIVLAGQTQIFGSFIDFAVARYNADGSLDSGFGANHNGMMVIDFAGDFDQATDVALQDDGKIVVTGTATVNSIGEFALMRLGTDGSFDTSFGANHDGKVLTEFTNAYAESSGVVIQADGKILVAGYANDSMTWDSDAAVARYTSAGLLDTTFGADQSGMVKIDFGRIDDKANAIALQADGKILLAGYSNDTNGSCDFALGRLTVGGTLDSTFAGAGIVLSDFGGFDQAISMSMQADGKIVLSGHSDGDFALARYSASGALDSEFGTGGLITSDMGGSDCATAVTVDSEGGVIATGFAVDDLSGDGDFALARYAETVPPPPPPPPPPSNKVTEVLVTDPSTGLVTLQIDGTSKANVINVRLNKKTGKLEVLVNCRSQGLFEADKILVHGNGGSDVIEIANNIAQPVELFGDDGCDVLIAGKGDATLYGGAGRDFLYGGKGENLLDGGDGNDHLMVPGGNKNAAVLMGGAGNDLLLGGGGSDLLDGGDGNDCLDGRGGSDDLMGGTGKDHYTSDKKDVITDPDIITTKKVSKRR